MASRSSLGISVVDPRVVVTLVVFPWLACFNVPDSVGDGGGGTMTDTTGAEVDTTASSDPGTTTSSTPGTTGMADGTADATSEADDTTSAGEDSDTTMGGDESGSTGEPDACSGGPFAFTWQVGQIIEFSGNIQDLAGAHLNADPYIDLVAADYDNDQVNVYHGSDDGTFSLGTQVSVPGRPTGVALAAIADDTPDLFVSYFNPNNSTSALVIRRGNGAGGFQFGSGPYTPVLDFGLGYVNGDNRLDMVSTGGSPPSAQLRTSDITESFGAAVDITEGGGQPLLGDLDGDGDDDLVFAGSSEARVFLNVNGVFTEGETFSLGLPSGGQWLGDPNDDGHLDLVTGTLGGGNTIVQVFPGDGNGAFGAPFQYAISNYTAYVRVLDVDRDGIEDIVSFFGETLTFLRSNGDGTVASEAITALPGCNNARGIVLDDINDDCVADVIVGCLGNDADIRVLSSSI